MRLSDVLRFTCSMGVGLALAAIELESEELPTAASIQQRNLQMQSAQQGLRGDASPKRKPKQRPRPKDVTAGAIDARHHALTINYPLNFFDGSRDHWRTSARYSPELVSGSEATRAWSESSYAQDQEDVWLYENWFYGMEKGVIMESGALNGILFSTSYMFEHFANWTAIHVEADPENYSNLKVNRQNAVNVNGALCSEPRLLHYSSEGVIPVRGFIEFMTESFMKKWHGKVYNGKVKIEDLPTVQCLPVRHLLRELNVKHIDIWILDVEGAEESVLKGTDFNEVRFNAVAMECDEHDIAKNSRKTDILEANGFKCELIERNCMCKNNDHIARSAPQKSILRKWDGQKWAATYDSKSSNQ